MRTVEGEKRAKETRAQWNRENIKAVGTNVKKEVAEEFRKIAEEKGSNPGSMIRWFVNTTIAEYHAEKRLGMEHYERLRVNVSPEVGERLKEFSLYTGRNPDQLADLVLTQWMDDQLDLYGEKWDLKGRKKVRMMGHGSL